MTIAEQIRTFLEECPLLEGSGIALDYLEHRKDRYVIEGVPTAEIIRRYADGATVRRYEFVFGARLDYGVGSAEENQAFFQSFSEWLEEQTEEEALPTLGDGRTALKIEAVSYGYFFEGDGTSARYQIQCRLEYYQE